MKTIGLVASLLAITIIGTRLQAAGTDTSQSTSASTVPAPTPYQIVSQGGNFNVYQWQTYEPLPNGQFAAHTHSYTELSSGLNFQDPTTGQWVPSQELIEPYAQGAIAQRGQHRVIYANNLNTASGVIDEETPDGQRLTSAVEGLMYLDPTTGQSVQIAEVQDSYGQLIAANQVLYTNAFNGNGVKASVRFKYRRDGTEQDIILESQLPAPEAFGLRSDTAELVVVTEFLNPPEVTVSEVWNDSEEPDEAISWGATSLGHGKAFSIAGQDVPVVVSKEYRNIDGRYFLFEKVRYKDIRASLSSLPLQASNARRLPGMASRHFHLPKAPTGKRVDRPMRLALGQRPDKGYVLDYITLSTSFTNYNFQGDTCYFISGNVNLAGTNTFEGGTVIKYATNTSITVVSGGAVKFLSQPYRPVVFSCKDDNTIGSTISGSTGNPTGYYANPALSFSGLAQLSNFRISYAQTAVSFNNYGGYGTLEMIGNAQIVNCGTGVSVQYVGVGVGLLVYNALFLNVNTNFNVNYAGVAADNVTFANAQDLLACDIGNGSLYVTNSILVNVTSNLDSNLGAVLGDYIGVYQSQPFVGSPYSHYYTNNFYPFQRAGAASCYLTNGCAFFQQGTAGVGSNILAALATRTTHPPLVYSNLTFSVATNFYPQAQRDTNSNPDLGYHYDPLDYVFGAAIAQSNITFAAGTAVGFFYNSGGATYGLALGDSVTASFNGTATSPCRWARHWTVQEGNGNWTAASYLGGITGQSYTHAAPAIQATFTDCYELQQEGNLFSDNYTLMVDTARNCEFYSGRIGSYSASLNLTNCLFVNGGVVVFHNYGTANLTMENCTMFRSDVTADNTSGGNWPVSIVNCAFDSTTFYMNSHGGPTNGYYTDYNSFLVGSNTTLYLGGHEVFVTNSYNWQTSWLGNYYQLTNSPLIDKGSTRANQLGLYHFTTQTNQMKETNSIVDIGYHYVATDTNGNPMDVNGDGIPDYLQNPEGDGIDHPWETPWDLGIASQPKKAYVVQGQPATFSVTPSGIGPFTYQWQSNGVAVAGATNSNLTLLVAVTNDEANYSAVVSNWQASVTSSNAALWVATPVAIPNSGQPVNITTNQGATASFSVGASGNHLVYQWFVNNAPLSNGSRITGATNSTLTISSLVGSDTGNYTVTVTNLFMSVTSLTATLTVITNPWIATNPVSATNVIQSDDVSFSVAANGSSLSYQWWLTNSLVTNAISGATNSIYTKLVVTTNDAGNYSVIITNLAGKTNANASLTVLVPPWITSQPANVLTNQGSNATFTVSAFGTTNLYYQWFKNQTNAISGATNASLTLLNVQSTDAAGYSCLVTNLAGTNFSATAWLSVILTGGGTTNGWGGGGGPPAPAPVVSMFSPTNAVWTNAAVFPYGPPISIRALASSQYSYITNVAFYFTGTNYGTNFVFAGNAVPGQNTKFALAWTNALPGTNIVKAVAWDCNGNTATSPPVYVIMAVPPAISAGPNTNLIWTEGASGTNINLYGSISNDGQPYSWITNIQWSVVSPNGQYVSFSNPHLLTPQATFTTNGTYQLQLQVDNGFATNTATCTVTIKRQPFINFNWPTNNAKILFGPPIVLNATATSQSSFITNVTFYNNTNSVIGSGVQSLNNTFTYVWYSPPVWTNLISAVAIDNDGLMSTATVSVVMAPLLAVEILSPTNQTFIARTNVTITAYAFNSATIYSANYVEFFDGPNNLGYAASSNNFYQITWYPTGSGAHVLTALAVNTNGASAWSAPVTNYVVNLPSIQFLTPTNGQIFAGSPTNLLIKATATPNWGTIAGVGFFQGTNAWWPTNSSSPYAFTWTNAPAGTYTLSAQATNNYGMVGIASNITITVEPTDQQPQVYAGPNQTNYLSTNTVPLHGVVSDDGLPLGSVLTAWWTNSSGGTNVTFLNTNLPTTSARYWATGAYVLTLFATDGALTNSSSLTVTVLPGNLPPRMYASPTQTLILPALIATNPLLPLVAPRQVTILGTYGDGADYFPASNCIVASANEASGPFSFMLVYTNGLSQQFSSLSNMADQTYVAAVRDKLGGFKVGEVFANSGADGTIMRIEPDGTTVGTNRYVDSLGFIQTNAWVVITNQIWVTNAFGQNNVGALEGGLWVDRTGVWGGDLIVSTTLGYVFRINAAGKVTLIADLNGTDAPGITTIPNNVQKYGPWAGRILVGSEFPNTPIYAIDTNGNVVSYSLGIGAETIRVIPENEDFYGIVRQTDGNLHQTGYPFLYGVSAQNFHWNTGDILVTSRFSPHTGSGYNLYGGDLYRIQWNGTNFNVVHLGAVNDISGPTWSGGNFVPLKMRDPAPNGSLKLNGYVTDDGEIFPTTSNQWNVISGPGPVTFADATITNTVAEFSVPGDYLLQLSAYDGQYTSTTNVDIHVLQNQPPYVYAGPNQLVNAYSTTMAGVVTDDGLPYGITNIVWSVVSGVSSYVHFAASNNPTTSVTFDNSGIYTLMLTADDGQATNSSQVTITVSTASLSLTPGHGTATDTNTSFTMTARLLDVNGSPITNSTINFNVSGPNNTNASVTTDNNGYASFTYYDTSAYQASAKDTIYASSPSYGVTSPYIYKDWAMNIHCGDVGLDHTTHGGPTSIEWTNNPAAYYSFQGTSGDSIHLTLVQWDGPLAMVVRNPSGQVVASAPASYSGLYSVTSLNYGLSVTGKYLIEITGTGTWYDLYCTCDSQTNNAPNMEILYNGNIVPNGGTAIFPPTSQGVATNITLVVTNAGTGPFAIVGYGTNGNFVLTNNIGPGGITVNAGTSTNLGIAFGAVTNGVNFGALVLATNAMGSNYIINFEATAYPTDAVPTVQFTQPLDGNTILDSTVVPFTVLANPGSAPITSINLQLVTTNSLVRICGMQWVAGNYYITNYLAGNVGQAGGLPTDGDYAVTATAIDASGQSNSAPPVLLHIRPYASPYPPGAPSIQVSLNGTNLPSGSTVVLPQTLPFLSTNAIFLVTNAGSYVLWITNEVWTGDFTVSANGLGPTLPGGSTNFTVTFNASSVGTAYGELTMGNNASSGGFYVLNLIGNAYPPGYVPPSTNTQPPVAVDATFHVQANSMNNILNPLANDYDTNNYPLTIQSVTNPYPNGGMAVIINNGTAIRYTPPKWIRSETNNGVEYPADGFYYTISDGHGGTAQATVYIDIDASDIPVVTIASPPSPYSTNAGSVVPIIASVIPPENVVKMAYYLDGTLIGTVTNGPGNASGLYTNYWTAVFDNDGNSLHQIQVQATDKYGQMGPPGTLQITVNSSGLSGSLVAALDSLVDANGTMALNASNNIIRDGLFQLYGRAYHSLGSNVVWQLGVFTADGTLVRNLTPSTTGPVEGSGGTSNLLLNCDLTTLMNGAYTLTLTVNGGYQMASASVPFRLESNLKVGQFSFSQQDLVIPVNGIPLTVTRTYNSINPDKGDYGYGWTYSLENLDVSIDETRQEVVDNDGNLYSERSGGGWDVTLTLPDGRRTTFYFSFDGPYGVDSKYYAKWQAAPGINYKLGAFGNPYYDGLNGCWNNESGLGFNTFDFAGFYLTNQDGTVYVLSRPDLGDHFMLLASGSEDGFYVQAYGPPYLSQVKERSGDTITINPNSIVYAATNGATRQIVFQRNADGLITSISDPDGLTGGVPSGPPAVQYQYDSSDNLISVLNLVNRNGAGTYVTNSFTYTNASFPHYITGIINANGTQVAKNFYDNSGKLIAVQDADGNLTQFFHNLTNDSEVIIDRLHFTNTYVYDLRGDLIVQTNQLGQITTMAYDANNNKTNEITYLNGQSYATNSYVYDTNLNVMLSSIDPLGHTNGFVYDNYGNMLTNFDAFGHPTANVYDGNGNLISTTDALGHGATNFYSGSQMFGSVDAIGTMTTNYYDPSTGYLLGSATLDASRVILSTNTFAYDANGNRTNSTVWRQVGGVWTAATTRYVYDAMNRVVQTINPDGGTNTVFYNAIGKQQATIDPLGHTTSYTYDDQGRLFQTTYADTTTEKSFYDANGNRVRSVDRANRTTTYGYDPLNRLVQTIYPDNTTNSTVYDGVGRVTQTVDARGTITAFAYDAAGRRLAVTNAFGAAVAMTNFYSYDANGNQITFTDGLGHTTTNVFDTLNRSVQTVYPNGTTNSTGYDAAGRRVAMTNQDGVVTLFGYDGVGRLISVTDALSQVTRYQYDEAGNEVAQIDGLNRTNLFTYDSMGRRILHGKPDTSNGYLTEGFTYDFAGNLIAHTNFNYITVFNLYNQMNRLTNSFDNTSFSYSYSYTATGQRQNMFDSYNYITYSYIYDSRDRLAQKVVAWYQGPAGVLNYGYDADGNVTNIASGYGNGVHLAYGYDALNRLTNVLSHGLPAAVYNYDAAGNLAGMRYGNGVTNFYQYDALNRLTNLVWQYQGTARASFAYQLKPGGTRTNLAEIVNGTSRTFAWSYDNLYRLTNEVVSGLGNLSYVYDAVGNRSSRTSSGITQLPTDAYTYATNDELIADSFNNFHSNSYDANGNTVNSGNYINSYAYDGLNRLIQFGSSTNFAYDGDGNRVKKTTWNSVIGNVPTYYLVDDRNPSGYPQVLEEYQMATNLPGTPAVLSRAYNYGLALISQQQFNTNTLLPSVLSYYGYDGHGNVRFLTDTNGVVTDTYTYDAYGTLIASSGSTPNNYLYCGQQYDPDLRLYYNRARYLNTDLGRFWSMDTYAGNNDDPLSLHKYLYAQGNPVDGSDPSGYQDTMTELAVETGSSSLDSFPNITTIGEALSTGGKCGSDVTKQLQATLDAIESDFKNSGNEDVKKKMCLRIVGKDPVLGIEGAKNAWYITELASPTLVKGYSPPAGLDYGSGSCWPSVAIDGKCYYTHAVNYAMWGKIMKLAYDYMKQYSQQDDYTLASAEALASAYKYSQYGETPWSLNVQQALAFTRFGYNGSKSSLGAVSIVGAYVNPQDVCTIKGVFNWVWLPGQSPR